MFISVIVPVYNGEGMLARCLNALTAETDPDLEIIVVDDKSTDRSIEIARSFDVNVLELKKNSGPGPARNAGVKQAKGEIILFVDADVELQPGAIGKIRSYFQNHSEASALIGSYDDKPSVKTVISQYRNLLHHYVHQTGPRQCSHFWTGLGAVRTSDFWRVGGFGEGEFAHAVEDVEFGYRMRDAGLEIHVDPTIQGTHLKHWTFASMVRTDIFVRGIPWTRLILMRGEVPNDFSLSWSHKASVLLAGLAFGLLLLSVLNPVALIAALVTIFAFVLVNFSLFRFFASKRGLAFAAWTVALHLLYNFYTGFSFAAGLVLHRFTPRPKSGPKVDGAAETPQ